MPHLQVLIIVNIIVPSLFCQQGAQFFWSFTFNSLIFFKNQLKSIATKKNVLKSKGIKRRPTPITRAKKLENIVVIRWLITNSIQPQPYQRPPKLKLYFHTTTYCAFLRRAKQKI
jgi:hypothetical protein